MSHFGFPRCVANSVNRIQFLSSLLSTVRWIAACCCLSPCFPSERSQWVHPFETRPYSHHMLSVTPVFLRDLGGADKLTSLVAVYILNGLPLSPDAEIKVLSVIVLEGHCPVITQDEDDNKSVMFSGSVFATGSCRSHYLSRSDLFLVL